MCVRKKIHIKHEFHAALSTVTFHTKFIAIILVKKAF